MPTEARRPLVISHRTQMGTHPENTLAGIDAALVEAVDGIELDVRATADGVPVLLHDESLTRTTGDPRLLAQAPAAEVAALRVADPHGRAGPQPLPTLEEALATVAGRATLYLEVKERGLEAAVAAAVHEAGAAPWCWVWAFDPRVAAVYRLALPDVPVALNVGPTSAERFGYAPGSHLELARRAGFAAVSVAHSLVDAADVEAARARGLDVFAWTVDEPADIARVATAGVTRICSNFPSRVRAVLAS